MSFELIDDEKKFLLSLARKTIGDFLNGEKSQNTGYFSENLKTKSGAFVTLTIKHNLRGCIGYVQGYKALQDSIVDIAVSSAFNDPRFPPLTKKEFNDIEIEISVLTPLTKIKDISEIEIGRDGLIIKQLPYEGLLLPQVATEYNWDVQTFLEHTCNKAGLPSSAWKDEDTEILKFSAIIFKESDFSELCS